MSNKIKSIKGQRKRRWSIGKITEDETETKYTEKRINKQTITATTTKNNQTLRMQKRMCITCSIVLRLNQFSMLIGKSSPVFSFSFFSPAMKSELPWLQRPVLKIPNMK